MQLLDCLHHTPVRTLLALCQANGFACPASTPKDELAVWLHGCLSSRCRASYLAQLPPDHLAILHALAHQSAPWPLTQFEIRFGQIRPYHPWRQDAPRHPWRAPVSAAEALVYRGLIFVIKTAHQSPHVLLPSEIAELLRQPQVAALPFAPAPPVARALLDLTLLLAYLEQAEVQPLHGRWLSPQHCQRLGACLAPPLPAGRLPSQRHSPRLAFAHFLAERLHLVTIASGFLKPSPAATAWLEHSIDTQLSACWQAWLAPDDANRSLWRRFHLPGHTLRDPVGFARRLIDRLAPSAKAGLYLVFGPCACASSTSPSTRRYRRNCKPGPPSSAHNAPTPRPDPRPHHRVTPILSSPHHPVTLSPCHPVSLPTRLPTPRSAASAPTPASSSVPRRQTGRSRPARPSPGRRADRGAAAGTGSRPRNR